MAAIAVNASEDYVLGFDDGAGLEAPLECPEYSKEAEEILVGRRTYLLMLHFMYSNRTRLIGYFMSHSHSKRTHPK